MWLKIFYIIIVILFILLTIIRESKGQDLHPGQKVIKKAIMQNCKRELYRGYYYRRVIYKSGSKHWVKEFYVDGFDCSIMQKIAFRESSLLPWKTGDDRKSHGLFQLQRKTATDYGFKGSIKGLYKHMRATEYATRYFNRLLILFDGDLYKAIDSYNMGRLGCLESDYCGGSEYVNMVLSGD